MALSLAVKYRPHDWSALVEQSSIKIILQQQLKENEIKNAYLFVGGAGTGKTTTARIFANEINKGQGNPVELDAASNNSVEDIRNIIQQAKTKALDAEYKIFILDEVHALSNSAWQAMLKLIEEPSAKSIFIFCTTNPEKIPKTILSRVQRYDFRRISQKGIEDRLQYILDDEHIASYHQDAVEYLAKIADGGMRDAITLMDKCLAYSKTLTLENVIKALGTVDYLEFMKLTENMLDKKTKDVIILIEDIYSEGKDIKQFIKQYIQFLLDINKYAAGCDWKYLSLPKLNDTESWLKDFSNTDFDVCRELLSVMLNLSADIKYSSTPKYDLEAALLLECEEIK